MSRYDMTYAKIAGTAERKRRSVGFPLVVLLLASVSACASAANHRDEGSTATAASSPTAFQAADEAYQAAVRLAAVGATASEHPLRTIPASEASVTVVTWTDWGGYRLGPNKLTIDLWVTRAPEVQEACRSFSAEMQQLRLQQLLGLPTSKNYVRFVVMEAKRSDLFRPCPDPDPSRATCSIEFPPEASVEHRAWVGAQAIRSYRVRGGFPWTRLGYTFDWSPGEHDRYGASEFVIREGATVEVKEIVPTAEYCRPMATP